MPIFTHIPRPSSTDFRRSLSTDFSGILVKSNRCNTNAFLHKVDTVGQALQYLTKIRTGLLVQIFCALKKWGVGRAGRGSEENIFIKPFKIPCLYSGSTTHYIHSAACV